MSDSPITSDVLAGKLVVKDQPKPDPARPKPEPASNPGSAPSQGAIERSREHDQRQAEIEREGDAFHRSEAARAALDRATSYTAYQQASPPVPDDLGAELAALHQALLALTTKIKNRNLPGDMPVVMALAEAHARIEVAKTGIQGA